MADKIYVSAKLYRVSWDLGQSHEKEDKKSDEYLEIVTNPKNGEILHRCEEPLSHHQGHWSAKKKQSSEQLRTKESLIRNKAIEIVGRSDSWPLAHLLYQGEGTTLDFKSEQFRSQVRPMMKNLSY